MRRLLSIATIVAVGVTPVLAQRGMGGAGARGGGGAARGGATHFSAPMTAPAARVGPVVAPRVMTPGVVAPHVVGPRVVGPRVVGPRVVGPRAVGPRAVGPRVVTSPVGVRAVAPSSVVVVRGPFRTVRFRRSIFFHDCFNGFNCNPFFFPGFGFGFGTGFGFGFGVPVAYPYPYYPGPYYPPDYYSSPSSYYPPEYYSNAPQAAPTENSTDVYLATMLQKLTDEVESLKNEQRQKYQTGGGAAVGPTAAAKPGVEGPAVTFVFRDGRRITAHNYAVSGGTLWVFSENAARKYQLVDLDRAATEQVNAANGIDLHLPEPAPPR